MNNFYRIFSDGLRSHIFWICVLPLLGAQLILAGANQAVAMPSPCSGLYVTVQQKTITVLPTGTDDTANLQCAIDLGANHRKCRFFQNLGDRVSDLAHDDRGSTGFHIHALITLPELRFACARERRQRAFNQPDHVGQRNLVRRFGEVVAAAFAFLAENNTASLQRQKNLFEESSWNGFILGQLHDQYRALTVLAGQRI